jgi:hypothetical protein
MRALDPQAASRVDSATGAACTGYICGIWVSASLLRFFGYLIISSLPAAQSTRKRILDFSYRTGNRPENVVVLAVLPRGPGGFPQASDPTGTDIGRESARELVAQPRLI